MTHYNILAVNPGSTSTKITLYLDEAQQFVESIEHVAQQLEPFATLLDQHILRKDLVLSALAKHGVATETLDAVVGRGGLIQPMKSGGYLVDDAMLAVLHSDNVRQHASNLGAIIADSIARPLGIPAYIYDAVGADELSDVAKITGIPEIVRNSFCHVLNTKATGGKVAAKLGSSYDQMNFVIAHIGGGISVSAHKKGKIVDVIPDDAGPFSPERAGSVPLGYIIDMCYDGKFTKAELIKKLKQNSGIKGHLGTNDCRKVERMIANGDCYAAKIYEAQAYQIAKGIGEMAPVLCGEIDAVILTGGMAYSTYLTNEVKRMVSFLGPVFVMPGENEMESLSLGALRILRGEENCHRFGD